MKNRGKKLCVLFAIILMCFSFQPSYARGFLDLFGFGNNGPKPGETVTITAPDRTAEGLVFDHWEVLTPNVHLEDVYSQTTSFVMPNGVSEININPVFKAITTPTPKPIVITASPTTPMSTPTTTPTPTPMLTFAKAQAYQCQSIKVDSFITAAIRNNGTVVSTEGNDITAERMKE